MSGWAQIRPAAKYAGVGVRTFREWLKQGLPHSRVGGGHILVKLADIDEFLECHRSDPAAGVDQIVTGITRELGA